MDTCIGFVAIFTQKLSQCINVACVLLDTTNIVQFSQLSSLVVTGFGDLNLTIVKDWRSS